MLRWFKEVVGIKDQDDFETARIQATSRDTEQPPEPALRTLIQTLKGRNKTLRPHIAFIRITSRLSESNNRSSWIYITKNLIILERSLEEKLFVTDILNLSLECVKTYREPMQQAKLKTALFLNKYYHYLKLKANLFLNTVSIFNVDRHQRKVFIERLSPKEILCQLQNSGKLLSSCLQFSQCSKSGIIRFATVQYVYQLILITILTVYTAQQQSLHSLLKQSNHFSVEQARKLKSFYNQFISYSHKLITFMNYHKNLAGYDKINLGQFYKPNKQLGVLIENLLEELESGKYRIPDWKIQQIDFEESIIIARNSIYRPGNFNFRRRLKVQYQPDPFVSYINCLSKNFKLEDYVDFKLSSPRPLSQSTNNQVLEETRKSYHDSNDSFDNIVDPLFQGNIKFIKFPNPPCQFINIFHSTSFAFHSAKQ